MSKPKPPAPGTTGPTPATEGRPAPPTTANTLAHEIAAAQPLAPEVVEEEGHQKHDPFTPKSPAPLLTFVDAFTVGAGGALGSVGRYALATWLTWRWGSLPLGILLINTTGSFAIGFFEAATGPGGFAWVGPHGRRFFMIGVCGGYTTFSSFALQSLDLTLAGHRLAALANVLLSFVLCLAFVAAGRIAATGLRGRWRSPGQ